MQEFGFGPKVKDDDDWRMKLRRTAIEDQYNLTRYTFIIRIGNTYIKQEKGGHRENVKRG